MNRITTLLMGALMVALPSVSMADVNAECASVPVFQNYICPNFINPARNEMRQYGLIDTTLTLEDLMGNVVLEPATVDDPGVEIPDLDFDSGDPFDRL